MNFIKKICYVLFCKLYRINIDIYYKIKFIKSKIKNLNSECLRYVNNNDLNLILKLEKKKLIKSEYQEVYIFNNKEIKELINFIFDEKFRKFLLKKTNCCFSIDFLSIYKNKYLNIEDRKKSIYANLMHIDKPFSKYTLKVFIPINVKSHKFGPLEIKVIKPLNFSRNYNKKI